MAQSKLDKTSARAMLYWILFVFSFLQWSKIDEHTIGLLIVHQVTATFIVQLRDSSIIALFETGSLNTMSWHSPSLKYTN